MTSGTVEQDLEAELAQLESLPEEERVAGVVYIALNHLSRSLGRTLPEAPLAIDILTRNLGSRERRGMELSEAQYRALVMAAVDLLVAEGIPVGKAEERVAETAGVKKKTVTNWRNRWRKTPQARAVRIDRLIEQHIAYLPMAGDGNVMQALAGVLDYLRDR